MKKKRGPKTYGWLVTDVFHIYAKERARDVVSELRIVNDECSAKASMLVLKIKYPNHAVRRYKMSVLIPDPETE